MSAPDLVIRGDRPRRHRRARLHRRSPSRMAASSRSARVAARGREEIDAKGLTGHARLRGHPHPLRRPGGVGFAPRPLRPAWRDHGGDGQLRRGLRAGAAPGTDRQLIELMEGVEDIPGPVLHEGLELPLGELPEYMDALEPSRATSTSAPCCRMRAARACHGRARAAPGERDQEDIARCATSSPRRCAPAPSASRPAAPSATRRSPATRRPRCARRRRSSSGLAAGIREGGGDCSSSSPTGTRRTRRPSSPSCAAWPRPRASRSCSA
jgi:hypothetical protein